MSWKGSGDVIERRSRGRMLGMRGTPRSGSMLSREYRFPLCWGA